MTSLWKNEILSPELPKLVNFSKKNRLWRAKIDGILEPILKNFRLRRAEYLLTYISTYLLILVEVCKQCGLVSNQ